MSEFKSLPETQLEKAEYQETNLFYKYLCKDKTLEYIEIDKTMVRYGIKDYLVEVTFKIKK